MGVECLRVSALFLWVNNDMSTQSTETKIAVMAKDIENIKTEIGELKTTTKDGFQSLQDIIASNRADDATKYITRNEFGPVQKIVYGLVTVILIAVVGAIVGLVLIP